MATVNARPQVQEAWSSNPEPAKLYTTLQTRFAIAATSMQAAVLTWYYDVKIGTGNSLQLRRNMVSIMKG